MVIALDSNVVIDLMRGHPAVRANHFLALAAQTQIVLSTLVVEEIAFGIDRHRHADGERILFEAVSGGMEVTPFERLDSELCGRTRALMQAVGRRPPYADALIGAHALARDHTLVTANTRDFQHIPGLRLLDWRQPPSPAEDLLNA